jgi:hypothetical protein
VKATDKYVRDLPTTARLVNGQVIVENKICGILFSFPAAVWPDKSMSAHQRIWVERLTPWWDMEQPQWSPTSQRLRESVVKAINKLFECGSAVSETADIHHKKDASTSNGEGERANRSALDLNFSTAVGTSCRASQNFGCAATQPYRTP